MSKPKDPIRMFDTRTIERNIKYGWLTHAELDKHLSALPDIAHKAVTLGEIEDRRGREAAAAAAAAPTPAPASTPQIVVSPAAPSDPFGDSDSDSDSDSGF